MQEMQALVATEPSRPAEEAELSVGKALSPRASMTQDTPRSGASGTSLCSNTPLLRKL